MLKVFVIITNLILCYFDINIIINDSKSNEIILDLRFFSYTKIKKFVIFQLSDDVIYIDFDIKENELH